MRGGEEGNHTDFVIVQALRRSIKGEKENKAQHISIAPKQAVSIVPPKKVRSSSLELRVPADNFF